MFLNIPEIKKKDIKYCGIIFKDNNYFYILSDLKNRSLKNTLKLNGYGFYSYVYDVFNTYLFIIGNQIKNKDVNPKNIDFVSKVLKFEYMLSINKVQGFDIPSQVFTITSKEKWLQDDFIGDNKKMIDNIIKHKKVHLQAYKQPYERYMRYLCDNPSGLGIFKNSLCKDTLITNKIYLLKDTSFDGYIIKYDNRKFIE